MAFGSIYKFSRRIITFSPKYRFQKKMLAIKIFILLAFSNTLKAQNDTINGFAPSYKNVSINIFKQSNPFYDDTIVIKKIKPDTSGFFTFTLNVPKTTYLLLDLDYYQCYFYLRPNTNYTIILPKRKKTTLEQKISPFFMPIILPVIVKKPNNNLNNAIADFSKLYSEELKITLKNKNYYDSALYRLKQFNPLKDTFFNTYKKYKIALFKYYILPEKNKKLIKNYLANQPIYYNNPAYISFFNSVIENIFSKDNSYVNIKNVYHALKTNNLELLKNTVKETELFGDNPELIELVICKGLYDLYYDLPPAQNDIIKMIALLSETSSYTQIRKYAQLLYQHFTTLKVDYPAPEFSLPNKKHKLKSLADFQKKFIYLQFCNPASYACQKQMPLLKKYYKTKPKNLEIITIFVADTIEKMKKFISNKKYKWVFLFWNKDYKLLKKYNIKTYPTYYLIYPDGTLALNPAPTPEENLQEAFADIYKKWKNKKHKTFKENN